MEARESWTPCFFVSILTIKYYRILNDVATILLNGMLQKEQKCASCATKRTLKSELQQICLLNVLSLNNSSQCFVLPHGQYQ